MLPVPSPEDLHKRFLRFLQKRLGDPDLEVPDVVTDVVKEVEFPSLMKRDRHEADGFGLRDEPDLDMNTIIGDIFNRSREDGQE